MPLRLTTQGTLLALAAVLAAGGGAAWHFVGSTEPAVVEIAPKPQAGPQTRLSSFNPARVYELRAPGVVTVEAYSAGGQPLQGSGFVVDGRGYIVTSQHVVVAPGGDRSSAVFAEFASGDRVAAEIVGTDDFSDIAVLKVDADDVKLHPVPLADSDRVIVGEPVAAIGSPFGREGSLSIGVVSGLHRTRDALIDGDRDADLHDLIQTDAAINHGNSGGPLFDAAGRVIGLNAQIESTTGRGEGVGYAIPSNTVKRSLDQIRDGGKVSYAYVGVSTITVTPQMASALGFSLNRGAMVSEVQPGSPAAQAGLTGGSRSVVFQGQTVTVGDQIVSLAGAQITSQDDMMRVASRLEVGQKARLVFYRAAQRHTAMIVPSERQT